MVMTPFLTTYEVTIFWLFQFKTLNKYFLPNLYFIADLMSKK